MTALALRLPALRRLPLKTIAAALLALAAGIALAIALMPARDADAATLNVKISAAKAAQLINATSGAEANSFRATGDQAKLINASLPFAGGPVLAARPFEVSGSDLDHRRALLCLTQAVYYEAGFEPVEGRRAVAQVVLNRMRHPAFPKSVCGVVYQNNGRICQFTFACDGSLNRAPAAGAWKQAEATARAALGGYVERIVGGATHYHADYVAPRWAPLLAKVSVIGQHIFYRWPGTWGQPGAFTGRYIGEPRDPLSLRPTLAVATIVAPTGELTAAPGPVTDGTVLQRAPNDVGGLLDTSKGWTLTIPGPEDGGSAAKLIASQQAKPAASAPAKVAAATTAGTQVASR